MIDYIGKYVKKYESGTKGSLSLSQCGNDWGLSCGSYQLTLRWGNCIKFLKKFFPNETKSIYFNSTKDVATPSWPGANYCSSPEEVKKVWKICYNKVGAEQFFEYEHQYIEAMYYTPFKKAIKDYINLDNTNRAFQECCWSWAVHKGSSGAKKELLQAHQNCDFRTHTDEEIFDAIYDVRYKNFPYNRYKKNANSSEREDLRKLLTTSGYGVRKVENKFQPIVCMQTMGKCYRNTQEMEVKGVLWHSTGANNPNLSRYVQPSDNDPNKAALIALIGDNKYNTDWNHTQVNAGLNAFIGYLRDGSVGTIQTMPWNFRPWGCGSGIKGSCNNGWIQFEICEDNLQNEEYFREVYKQAVYLTAYLCKKYNLNPKGTVNFEGQKVPVILCHSEAHALGLGSNHADVMHWFPKYGKSMQTVREDVAMLLNTTEPEEEEEVTQEQFNEMMNTWLLEQAKLNPSAWSANERNWAETKGLVKGDQNGRKMYKKPLTREEAITLLYRALNG